MIAFHKMLSDRTVYLRYFSSLSLDRRITHERLLRICTADYEREMVLVAELRNSPQGRSIIAVGRLNKLQSGGEAEVAVLVSDRFQGLGLGTELLCRLVQIARDKRVTCIEAETLHDNITIQALVKKLGFALCRMNDDPGSVQATLKL